MVIAARVVPSNASGPMLEMPLLMAGIVTFVRLVQSSKALVPMVVTPLLRMRSVSPVQEKNAE